MSMIDWAEREIDIACKRERGDNPENEWDYGCACYQSALKAFKSLCEDGHSGMSIGFTKAILNRLIDGKPLTPIEDTPDIWNEIGDHEYQCKRMSGLFKKVSEDGSVTYNDVNRFVCVDICNENNTYHSGLVNREINRLYPVTMPYYPAHKPYRVYVEDFLTDKRNGDFDTVGIFYVLTPDDRKVRIDIFYAEGGEGFIEISQDEYEERKKRAVRK